jgi:thymidylate kinase
VANSISDNPVLIIVRGLPGSGKTYIANELGKAFDRDQVVKLDPDATDYESAAYTKHVEQLTEEGVDPKLHAYRFLRAQAYDGIKDHKVVIWNQPFTNLEIFHKMMDRLNTHAAENNTKLSVLVVEVEIDPLIAKARVDSRRQAGGHGPSDDTFTRFVHDYKTFSNDGYNTVTVSGDTNVSESVTAILEALNTLRHNT